MNPVFGIIKRLICDFGWSHRLVLRQRIAGTHHQHQAIAKNRMSAEARRFYRKRDDADIESAVFNLFDHLAAEVAINADLHGWKLTVELGEDIGQNVEARCFVGADRERATRGAGLGQ